MNNFLHHSRNIVTSVDEFDFKENIKPSAIMQYFQDLATIHASEIGIGFEKMKSAGLCWVLNRLSAVIDKSPALGEEIIITTYPHKPGVVEALRDYYVTNTSGESLIRGTSRWCVLDITNRAIRRCAPLFDYDDSVYFPENAVGDGNPQLQALDSLYGDTVEHCGKVNITDLDRNGHVNNARYGDIAVNCCDYDFYSSHRIKSFDFNFLSEMTITTEYKVQTKLCDNISYFEATGNTKTNPIFRAKITWE